MKVVVAQSVRESVFDLTVGTFSFLLIPALLAPVHADQWWAVSVLFSAPMLLIGVMLTAHVRHCQTEDERRAALMLELQR